MDFASKTRAGRAIMKWTMATLAERADVSELTIQKIENGSSFTDRTEKKIVRAFENAGVFFTRTGVERDDGPIVILSDERPEACYLLLLDDVYRVLKDKPRAELLITYADDRVSTAAINDQYRKMRASGVRMRQLVEEGNSYLLGPLDEYRCIPSSHFINRVTVIYGDNVAIVTDGENRITIIRDAVNAARERNTFNLLWSTLKPPTESTADEKFEQ